MLNKIHAFAARYDMVHPGDTVVCAVSGGADSMALLWGMYLLKEKWNIRLRAAHFNHHLRGYESKRDEEFVRDFCNRYDIPLDVGEEAVQTGEKGLEAAARQARYRFLRSLPGKIATAHTANDNAETVLLHMLRGTGLKGLGGIAPVNDRLIRPMLTVTRQEVLTFLEEYHIPYVEDSSNQTDVFLRNRLRHHVMPLLEAENPSLADNLTAMALRLRQDEAYLEREAAQYTQMETSVLRNLDPAVRSRVLERFLKENGVREPEAEHIALANALVFADNPSAKGNFPGGVTIGRSYDRLVRLETQPQLESSTLSCPGSLELPQLGLRVVCCEAAALENSPMVFTVHPRGSIVVRGRLPGDTIRLSGGSKSLKKLFIDRKIPAHERDSIPVIADDNGLIGVYGIGVHCQRAASQLPAVCIRFEKL